MADFEEHVKKFDVRGAIITSILTALSFSVALLWKDAITETLLRLLPHGKGVLSLFITAIVGTLFVVVLGYMLLKAQNIKKENIYSFKETLKTRKYHPGKLKEIKETIKLKRGFKYSYRARRFLFILNKAFKTFITAVIRHSSGLAKYIRRSRGLISFK